MIVKYGFLLYRLSHTTLVFDISQVGLPEEIYPPRGKEQMIPMRRFQTWKDVEGHLAGLEANSEAIREASIHFQRAGLAALTIVH
jgi:hypothetical protein